MIKGVLRTFAIGAFFWTVFLIWLFMQSDFAKGNF